MAGKPPTTRLDRIAQALPELTNGGEHGCYGSHMADRVDNSSGITTLLVSEKLMSVKDRKRAYAMGFINQGLPVPCKDCGKPINPDRLEALENAADRCATHQAIHEGGGK